MYTVYFSIKEIGEDLGGRERLVILRKVAGLATLIPVDTGAMAPSLVKSQT